MSQNRFRPIHEAHAISEQMVFFQFAPPLVRELPALFTIKEDLRHDLPESESIKVFQLDVSDEMSRDDIKDSTGLALWKLGSGGATEWQINIDHNSISIHCTNYTRWAEVWGIQKKYIKHIFSKISETKSFMSAVGIKWVDQFVYEGNDTDYDASEILKTNSVYLNPGAFNSGSRWHCHTGWFEEDAASSRKILNQLNVGSVRTNIGGHAKTVVLIDHTQQLRAIDTIDQLASYLPITEDGFCSLSDLMETLHSGNKHVLAGLLNEETCGRIALRGSERNGHGQ